MDAPIELGASHYAISTGEKVARKKSADPVDAIAIPNNEDLGTGTESICIVVTEF